MALSTRIFIEFKDGVYLVSRGNDKEFIKGIPFPEDDKLELLRYVDLYLVGRRHMRVMDEGGWWTKLMKKFEV